MARNGTTGRGRSSLQSAATANLLTSLRQRIRAGQYPAGTWLPTERDLADEFGVGQRAVRHAIARLAEERLVRRRPRFRPVVETPPAQPVEPVLGQVPHANSRLVALIMWHGAPAEGVVTAQQRIFWGMNQRLAQDGFHGVFLDLGDTVRSEQENAGREAARLRYALENGFAGVVFYAYAYRRNRELIQETGRRVPLVLIDRMIPGIAADFVGVDNCGAMYEATQHLLALGHRRILFVTTAESINTVQDRLEGYRQAMDEALGGPLPESVLAAPTDWRAPDWPVFEGLFRLPPEQRPTAVLCVNDFIARNVHRRLLARGLRVPEDVALCGFDDIIPFLPDGVGLTTVAQPFEQIGRAAAETFLARRAAGEIAASGLSHVELPARLVVRESTAGASAPGELPQSLPTRTTILLRSAT